MEMTNTLATPPPLRRGNIRVAALLALMALADVLIFNREPGLNLFLFSVTVRAGMLLF